MTVVLSSGPTVLNPDKDTQSVEQISGQSHIEYRYLEELLFLQHHFAGQDWSIEKGQ